MCDNPYVRWIKAIGVTVLVFFGVGTAMAFLGVDRQFRALVILVVLVATPAYVLSREASRGR